MLNEFILFLSESYTSYGFVFLAGLLIGSFLNVVIYRLPMMIDYDNAVMVNDNSIESSEDVKHVLANKVGLSFPKSHCTSCKCKIPFYHNIPVLSYILLKGKCFNCKEKFSSRYLFIELFTGLSFVGLFYVFGPTISFLAYSTLLSLLIAGSFIDIDNLIIPDSITIFIIALGLLFSTTGEGQVTPVDAILGMTLSIIPFYLFFVIYSLIRGNDKFGFGDIKYIAAIGAWVGIQGCLMALVTAPLIGIMFYILMMIFGKIDRHKPIAFIPFMSIGLVISISYTYLVNNGLI